MDIKQLSETLYVSAQITADQLPALSEFGIKSIICNRPDDEDPGQPSFAEISAAAEALGMKTHHQPVVPATMTPEAGAEFARLIGEMPTPILAYCRSGTRCGNLYMMTV